MSKKASILFIFFMLTMVQSNLFSQLNSFEDIEKYSEKGMFGRGFKDFFKGLADFGEPFQLAGGIGIGLRSYDAFGGPLRQDPFFYSVNAQLSVKIYQIELPVSLVMTAKNTTSSYPNLSDLKEFLKQKLRDKANSYTRIGISPYYKWAKLHLGHRAMNFSKYTMSNLNFFGAGIELNPAKFRISGMYGRLAKAEPIDLSLTTPNLPVYQRLGWAAKLGYGDEKASADITLFTAKDVAESINIPADYPQQVTPEANLAIGLTLQKLFFDVIRVKVDYGNSTMSPNALDADSPKQGITSFLMKKKTTTYNAHAVEASVAYEGKTFNAGVKANRVDSDYKTLGTYFFNKDIMDISGFTEFGLWEDKVYISLSAGVQTNNLDKSLPTTNNRLIYDAQIGYNQKAFSANYSFSNNTSRVNYILNQQLDSLNAVIVTRDMGLNLQYRIPSKGNISHTISATANMQEVSDDIEKVSRTPSSRVLLGNLSYALQLPADWSISLRGNYTQNEVTGIKLNRIGYGMGVRKAFLSDRLTLGLDAGMFNNKNGLGQKSANMLGQFALGYQIFKGMGLNLQWGLLRTTADNQKSFTESTGSLNLQYQFSYVPKKKEKKTEKNKDAK
ncbi:MAG: hypothetical protein J5I59_06960 [Saprospiraceae bacterium]|nr:hypothetical protein [Saprospiraceae bacterium]WKZ63814.1 MAG: hypothetical protein QY315_03275 [Saprospiraceae bacterium]